MMRIKDRSLLAAIDFMVRRYREFPPSIHLLPAEVEQEIAALATRGWPVEVRR